MGRKRRGKVKNMGYYKGLSGQPEPAGFLLPLFAFRLLMLLLKQASTSFFCKESDSKYLSSLAIMVSVTTTQICHYSTKEAIDNM